MNIIATDSCRCPCSQIARVGRCEGILYAALSGRSLPSVFMRDNLSRSAKGVLRVLQIQNPNAQGKLVIVLTGGRRWCITPRERIAGRTWRHALLRRLGSKWNQKSCPTNTNEDAVKATCCVLKFDLVLLYTYRVETK
jgi:hypothetical protein